MRSMNIKNLYAVQEYVDGEVGKLTVAYPILLDGSPDPLRNPIFSGFTVLQTNQGPKPLSWEIPGPLTIPDALEQWLPTLNAMIEKMTSQSIQSSILQAPNGSFGRKQ